eukprot:TRINITY_DN27556_c0_g1_i1.p1 TRINITY_DN27556_c0_g1~~TRINITY_DN27556_c0_g1_i1.p1  ORF type:complete len:385 (+),score=66.59 TRINITY_DN27556_c0_g1_i1:49-1203(+)
MSKRSREASADKKKSRESSASKSGYPTPATSSSRHLQENEQSLLRLNTEGPCNVDTKDFCGAFSTLEIDNSWDIHKFKKDFSIEINKFSDEIVEFDMHGIDPPLANAFRRILIAEVPTVAISRCTIYQNTSVIHDENMAHRLGLVPIKFEPDNLEWRAPEADFSEEDSIMFTLHKKCSQREKQLSIYSRDLCWKPLSEKQEERYKDDPPRPVDGDILLAHLKPGQEFEVDCYCEKGIGKDHAKYSPVCTATYRLLPDIRLPKDILGDDAQKLKKCCPMDVFDIEDVAGKGKRAYVKDSRKCTTCRECIESFPGQEKGLLLGKRKDAYIFTIESVGQLPATALFERALSKLQAKCERAKEVLKIKREEEARIKAQEGGAPVEEEE